MSQPMGPDPSGKHEYVEEREIERDIQRHVEQERARQEAMKDEPTKPSLWQRLFGKKR